MFKAINFFFDFVAFSFCTKITMLLLLPFLVILSVIIYWNVKNREFNKIPGPPGSFLFQNTLQFLLDPVAMFYFVRMCSNRYKRYFKVRFGPLNGIAVQEPKHVEMVLSKYNTKMILYDFVKPWLQEGLLTSDGSKWQQRRKLLTPTFHFNLLSEFKLVIDESCQKLVDKLRKEVNESKTDITPYVNEFALHSICETTMGVNIEEEDGALNKMYKDSIYRLGQYAVYRVQRVWMYPSFIFNLSTVGRKQQNIVKILTLFRDRVINNKRNFNISPTDRSIDDRDDKENNNVNMTGKKRLALLDLLLKAENAHVIDAKGIGEEVDSFIFGGHDTIANTLQFTLMLLANYQETQEKAINECNEIFGSSDRTATMADLAQMKFLECCIKESMRLYPPVPLIGRKIDSPLKIDDYDIKPGTQCTLMIFDIHRRADQFVEPQEFRPERFQTEPTWHPYAYIPFSAGPRNCLGQKFAMMELKQVLSALLRSYRFLPVTKPSDIIFVLDYVMRIKEPIFVKFEKRSQLTSGL